MATTRTTRKHTAANNAFLREVKARFNKPLYAMALDLLNGPDGPESGENRMRERLLKSFVRTLDF